MSDAASPIATEVIAARIDASMLAMKDEEFEPHTWEELRKTIATNHIEVLRRRPSDTRRYVAWIEHIKAVYGDVRKYLLQERLRWTPLPVANTDANGDATPAAPPALTFACANAEPFADPADYLILRNDWPYGLEPGIAHVVVWLKTPLEADMARDGDLTDDARTQVEAFVTRTFRTAVGEDPKKKGSKVLWFKNWVKLQSVRGVDHVHVLLRDAPDDKLEAWMR
ncbi:hypothetical protein BDY21DRAFT_374273 [Lineolata rhizophorae]|uniref:N-acetylglucosamine-induced protein 1 n=1 Tax=Lineolata rhizophorae TaxID=578093 RepID=A0A6A6NR85_9PEZI|nr:hypothetical protein BDY21DRAFT_374273 [Lineolata rhizophorae]